MFLGDAVSWAPYCLGAINHATGTINIKFLNYFYLEEHKIGYQMVYRTSRNVNSILSYEFFSELFLPFSAFFLPYSKNFTKKFITLDGINICCLIDKFTLFDIKIISKFYVYCNSRSDLWRQTLRRPNNTYRVPSSYLIIMMMW